MTRRQKQLLAALAAAGVLAGSIVAALCAFAISFWIGRTEFTRGYSVMNRGRYDAAIVDFNRALQHPLGRSTRAYALGDRGYCEAQKGDSAGAIKDYTEALLLDATLAFAYRGRGTLLMQQNDEQRALQDLSRVIALDRNDAQALCWRGVIYARDKQWDRAIADFSDAIRAYPKEPAGYVYRGDAYARQQKFSEALASFDSAVRVAPGYAPGYLHRGYVYHEQRDLYKAIADYSAAVRLAPDFAEAHRARIRAYVQKKDWRGAIVDYTELLRLNPRDEAALQGRGLAREAANDRPAALEDFTELVRITQSRQAYELRAGTLMLEGKYHEALEDYRTALRSTGPHGLAKSLAWLLATCPDSKFRSGTEAVAQATEDCVRTEWQNPNCVDTLAAAYAETGDFAEALRYEEQALAAKQIDPDTRAEYEIRLSLYRSGFPYRETGKHVPPKHSPTPAPTPLLRKP